MLCGLGLGFGGKFGSLGYKVPGFEACGLAFRSWGFSIRKGGFRVWSLGFRTLHGEGDNS